MIKCDGAKVSLKGSTSALKVEWMIMCHTIFETLYGNDKATFLKDANVAMMSEDELREETAKL